MKTPFLRIALGAAAVVLVALPLVLYVLKPHITLSRYPTFFPFPASAPSSYRGKETYRAESTIPERRLVITDPSFLTHVAAKWKIFEKDAVVDPLFYKERMVGAKRYTVSTIRFVLAPMTKRIEIVNLTGADDFGAKATYSITLENLSQPRRCLESEVSRLRHTDNWGCRTPKLVAG